MKAVRTIDNKVFDNIGPDAAWLLGLLFADGSLPRNFPCGIQFSSTDEDLVTQVKAVFKSDAAVRIYDPSTLSGCYGRRLQYRLYVSSRTVRERLEVMGVPRLKKDRVAFPLLEPSMVRHFIRGVFDGDGGVTIKGTPQAYFAGPIEFARVLREHLISTPGVTPSRLYLPKQTTSLGTFHIWDRASLPALYHYLYDGADVYGHRKYRIWQELLQKIGHSPAA